ncbi:hypothetical protein SAMN05421823_10432 [Catalinimonas alkaloidigena]|uniref:Lipocalin-like domain-containing protein n=1 Tax=Catalinimonas alkaloidigena TaxID=1075417 RepID=A0A1G9G9M6_9BACT|nr:hypothetical protein [Catalinimonas alkaloidigena]SDK97317.1 hypothetical protein SAMN05421823_10432 [Catalinimonas alkaloidigena]
MNLKTWSLLGVVALGLMLSSCIEDDPAPQTPRSEVPAKMQGQWMYGTFSMTDFWKYDGSYVGNAFELAVAFDFKKNGEIEMYFMSSSAYYNCRTQAFTYEKGTVEFHDNNSFTMHPTEGSYRGFYTCSPSQNFNRKAKPDELKASTYYYTFETDEYGKEHLVIRFSPDDEDGSYFRPMQW